MMNEAVEVEVNLTSARRKKVEEGEWRREEGARKREKEAEQPSTSNSQEARDSMIVKTLEKMMERLTVDGRPPHREQQNRNQNVGQPQILQNRARDQRIPPEHPDMPPFQ